MGSTLIERLASYQEGVEREQRKIVLKLLEKFLPEQVAEFSGVPLEKVKAMQEDSKS